MNRSKTMLVTLLLMSVVALAMNDDDDNSILDDATQKIARLDLNDSDDLVTPQPGEDRFAHMVRQVFACNTTPYRKPIMDELQRKKRIFFSPKFIAMITSNVHSHEYPHPDWVLSVAFDSKGKLFATASDDKKARIFDTEVGNCLYVLPHGNWV